MENLVHLFLFVPLLPPPVLDQLPFMMMSHPLIPASLAPASVSMAMGQMNRLSTLASMANVAHLHVKPPARAPTSVIKVKSRGPPAPRDPSAISFYSHTGTNETISACCDIMTIFISQTRVLVAPSPISNG